MAKPPGLELRDGDRFALIAGSGRLPVEVAEGLERQGKPPFVIVIEGEADTEAFRRYDHQVMRLEDAGHVRGLLVRKSVTHAVLAGGIARRPRLGEFRPSLGLLAALPRLGLGLARGDDGLLKLLIRHLEAAGIKVVGAHEAVPDLLAAEGVMTEAKPTKADWRDLRVAYEAALAIGRLDIGQAAISVHGRVIAVEGIEGTDGLLERARSLRSHGRVASFSRGVLVKCAKPGQELRADLPTIGPATVEGAHAAGLVGIGVEAGRSLILDWPGVMQRAGTLGIFVVGLSGENAS